MPADLAFDELKLASDEVTALAADSARARVAVLGYVGGETPGAVYRNALEQMTGKSARHVPASQLRSMVDMGLQARRTGGAVSSPSPLAVDAAPVVDFNERFGVKHAPRVL